MPTRKRTKNNQNKKTPARIARERAMIYRTSAPRLSRRASARGIVPLAPDEWREYRGETIAFIGDQILAHGTDLDRVLAQVRERYGKEPSEVNLFKVAKARHKLL
ncbi:MAG: hypothetical protein FJ009_01400 [Chloroflexi bacterium]|nr:hypothetical protein [Chloroflexota bacterium]